MHYTCFSLVLTVTHRCNLRCSYCYNRPSAVVAPRTISTDVATAAISRAVRSIAAGGLFELSLFGGEPLLAADILLECIRHARHTTADAGVDLKISLTTNGTICSQAAWNVMTAPEMIVSVSHDGLPEIHDRHRHDADGRGSAQEATATVRRLLDAGHEVHTVSVVRPDTVDRLPDGLAWLRAQGVRRFEPTLDLWTKWERRDVQALRRSIAVCADLWAAWLPECSISWFDEKAVRLARLSETPTARCGFGDGEIAVSPAGNLYPCERLIGTDAEDNPMRLPGHVLDHDRFDAPHELPSAPAGCMPCAVRAHCNTTCRCSNYVRTGDVSRPDGLLCAWNQICLRETARVVSQLQESKEDDHVLRRSETLRA